MPQPNDRQQPATSSFFLDPDMAAYYGSEEPELPPMPEADPGGWPDEDPYAQANPYPDSRPGWGVSDEAPVVCFVDDGRIFNPQQLLVIETPDGSVCVDACAGTGKTATIVERYARMIAGGMDPRRLLLVTFTVKGANEMSERIRARVGVSLPWATNFHKLCVRLLRMFPELGIPRGFTIVDQDDSKALVRRIAKRDDLGVSAQDVKDILEQVERLRLARLGYLEEDKAPTAAIKKRPALMHVAKAYEEALVRENKLDFDRIIHATLLGLRGNPEGAARVARLWDRVTIDEAQDTDRAQFELIALLAPHGQVCLVGDMDQSIYGFRGADYENLRRFVKDFNAIRLPLELNYRSKAEILEVANQVISQSSDRFEKAMKDTLGRGGDVRLIVATDQAEEATRVARDIQAAIRQGRRYSECAVLYRVGGLSRILEQTLTKHRIPYRLVGGLRFWERREVKDTLAYGKVLLGVQDPEAWRRATHAVTCGLGDKVWGEVMRHPTPEQGIDAVGRGKARDWLQAVRLARSFGTDYQALDKLLDVVGYRAVLGKDEDGADRLSNVAETINAMSEFGGLREFLDEAVLGLPSKDEADEGDRVTLSTIHGAKGLEWDWVHIVGLVESVLPHVWSSSSEAGLDEERRLLYVAMTRAKRRLGLSHPIRIMLQGRYQTAEPSRFLDGLPLKIERIR
jgi:DNA helicase-2/ATP-dependent DNA helicase PcrA